MVLQFVYQWTFKGQKESLIKRRKKIWKGREYQLNNTPLNPQIHER